MTGESSGTGKPRRQRRTLLLGLGLAIITLALYWPATKYDFAVFDDETYVYANPWVISGLSWDNVKWAFTSTYAANWHPLTWISHMLDWSIHGKFAGGHHLTNILLHTANSVLLFLVLKRLTRNEWPSALVAALFAWHPLHVESVAWVAERKDVLSTLLGLLTVWAYSENVLRAEGRGSREGSDGGSRIAFPVSRFYFLALLFFALGLMAKPMLVTLPCLLLLLDYWPLERIARTAKLETGTAGKLFVEKLPFFALSLAACVITVIAQHAGGAIKTLEEVPASLRFLNIPVAYARYLWNTICPINLCIFYPLRVHLPVAAAAGAVLVLAAISYLVFRWRATRPWLIVGWLWFLGSLVPVIGFVQVGSAALADRYTYIPLIGVFLMAAWSFAQWTTSRPASRILGGGVVTALLLTCLSLTAVQLPYWQNSIVLFRHALSVTPSNSVAENNLAAALADAGRTAEAVTHYQAALRLDPGNVNTRNNLAIALGSLGRIDEAVFYFSEALKLRPESEALHNNLGVLLSKQGKLDSAIEHLRQSIAINPAYPKPYLNLAGVLQRQGLAAAAATNYLRALHADPDWPEALDKWAFFLATCPDPAWRNPVEAIKSAQHADALAAHQWPPYLETLALAYANAGQFSNATSSAELAWEKARTTGATNLTSRLQQNLELYRAGKLPPVNWKEATFGLEH